MSISFSDDVLIEKFMKMADDVSTIKESLKDLPEIKKTVEHHEQIVTFGKWLSVPAFAFLHVTLKQILKSMGWQ